MNSPSLKSRRQTPAQPGIQSAKEDSGANRKIRILSLDWARGWMLVASITVNAWVLMPDWFNHAPWFGVNPNDVIFPIFVTLSGIGLAFANGRTVNGRTLLRRFVVLMLVGLLYNAITSWSLDVFTWRITGVLQLYAVLVAVISLLHLVTKSWQGWVVITVLLSFTQTLILGLFAKGCPSGILTPECNPSGSVDGWLFGSQHIYRLGAAGHDPEGLIVILGAIVTASAGTVVGHLLRDWLLKTKTTGVGPAASIGPLLLASAGFILLGMANRYTVPVWLGVYLPTMKRLWTVPFGLTIAAFTTLVVLIGHLLLDRKNVNRKLMDFSFPLLSLGRNSLLVYFGSHVLMSILSRPFGMERSPVALFLGLFPSAAVGQVVLILVMLTFWTTLAIYLHKRKIYIKP